MIRQGQACSALCWMPGHTLFVAWAIGKKLGKRHNCQAAGVWLQRTVFEAKMRSRTECEDQDLKQDFGGRGTRGRSEMNPPHQLLHRHRFCAELRLRALVTVFSAFRR